MDVIRRLENQRNKRMELFPNFLRVLILVYAKFSYSGFYGFIVGHKQGSFRKETGSCERKNSFGFVSTAFCTSNLPFAHSPNSFVYCPRLEAGVSQLRNKLSSRAISLILRL